MSAQIAIVPAYNEAASIGAVVAELGEHAPGFDVVVIDDGSTDDTAERARVAGAQVVRHPFNPRVGIFGHGTGKLIAVDDTVLQRGTQGGARLEAGIQLKGKGGAVEIFAGYEKRPDADVLTQFASTLENRIDTASALLAMREALGFALGGIIHALQHQNGVQRRDGPGSSHDLGMAFGRFGDGKTTGRRGGRLALDGGRLNPAGPLDFHGIIPLRQTSIAEHG